MSKSLGIGVDPVDIADRLGGEVVRLWVASVDFRDDVVGSEELMQRIAENYRKIRNTFRFVLSNLPDFDPRRDAVAFAEMEPLDRYMVVRAAELADRVRRCYETFEFHKVYHQIHDFCVVDLSKIYFDVLKDRLYTFAPESQPRRSAQTAIWQIGEALVRLAAPIMSFTAEEIWEHLPKLPDRPESVHLARFPVGTDIAGSLAAGPKLDEWISDWQSLFAIRETVLNALEAARRDKLIGGSLEAEVNISAPEPAFSVLERNREQLRPLFIVSAVNLASSESGNGVAGIKVEVARAPGQKCERCWNYSTHVGENKNYPTVCERCSAALAQIEAGAERIRG